MPFVLTDPVERMADQEIDTDIDLEPATGNQNEAAEDDTETDEELEASAEGDDEDGETEREPEPVEELIDYEEDGKKYKIPAALKGHLLRQSDYSRNMQALKERQQEAESLREEAVKWRQAEEAQQRTLGELAYVESQLKQWDNITPEQWAAWQASTDPKVRERANTSLQQQMMLERRRNGLRDEINSAKAKHETESKQATAKRIRETLDFASKEFPDWSDSQFNELVQFADSQGIGEKAARALLDNFDPGLLKVLRLARTGQKYLEAREAKSKQAKVAKKAEIVPLKTVATKRSSGSKPELTDKLSTEEWIKRRNSQLKQTG